MLPYPNFISIPDNSFGDCMVTLAGCNCWQSAVALRCLRTQRCNSFSRNAIRSCKSPDHTTYPN